MLLGAPGIATRSKKLLGAPGLTTSNDKLLETRIQCVSIGLASLFRAETSIGCGAD